MQVRPLDINELIDRMLRMLRRVLGENVTIDFCSKPGLPTIEADPGMIEQVLMNLCVNARDAMPAGGRLTIATETLALNPDQKPPSAASQPGQYLRLRVADTGCGMDAATQEHIFEPFFTTKEPGKGTGLGLATVFGIVQEHRGWIDVHSSVGLGSTFDVWLPVPRTLIPTDEPGPAAARIRGGSERILLVEDELPVRRMMAAILHLYGYDVVEAGDGESALEEWEVHAGRFDLLVSDMVMPGGTTGVDLARQLWSRRASLKVLIVSGYSAEIARGTVTDKMLHFLQKPCDAATLARAVRARLDADLTASVLA